jgi:DNA-binding protein HU-beta
MMNKKNLVDVVAASQGLSKKQSGEIVDLVFDTVKGALAKGDKVDVAGFGRFDVKQRKARTGINPKTMQKINIAATKAPGFKAAKALKDAVK